MKAAVYSRKSRFTGRGESTKNQIQLCMDYSQKHFNIDDYIVYEDEGFSGGCIDRPQYKKMIKDAQNKKFDILICYRLDRISRNISDFSDIIEILGNNGIGFVSIKEQFDTSTPMGRAMMYIASVFAQLERETIAERIRDNMHQLARSGRWLGGNTPTGYESESIVYIDSNMKEKKMYKLKSVKKDLDIVKILFDKYLEFQSLQKVETYCLQNNLKTKNDNDFHKNTIRMILTNPVYAKADIDLYNYFASIGSEISSDKEKFNGRYGCTAYNKRILKNNRFIKENDISNWIISVGKHKGIVSGKEWVRVQQLFSKNRHKFPGKGQSRKGTSHRVLLSGLLYCKDCGSFMRVAYGPKIKNTNYYYNYYECNLRFNSKRKRCANKRLNAAKVDSQVVDTIKTKLMPALLKNIGDMKKNIKNKNLQNQKINNKIMENRNAIDNLVRRLSTTNDEIADYILKEIHKLHKENKKLETKTPQNNTDLEEFNIAILHHSAIQLQEKINTADFEEKRNLIHSIVSKVEWDGENLDIRLFEY